MMILLWGEGFGLMGFPTDIGGASGSSRDTNKANFPCPVSGHLPLLVGLIYKTYYKRPPLTRIGPV